MRTKVDHLNTWWEPHATSTPLKKIPAQLEIENKAQKRVISQINSANILEKLQNANITKLQSEEKTKCVGSKRNRKSRLSTYFDPSSSSEDDTSEIKKRPIIKLGSEGTNNKVFLRHEEPENKKILSFNSCLSKNLKKNLRIENGSKTLKNISETVKNICTGSDEENKIVSISKRNKSLINENKSFLEKKENSINCTRDRENFRHPSDFSETERKKLKRTPKSNHTILKSKQIKRKTNKNSKLNKIKSEEVIESNDSKNLTGNLTSKNMATWTLKQTVNTASPLPILENKSNLSHQLFSESKEQEWINLLDLKSDKDDGVCTENKTKEDKPKGGMQTLEKHCVRKTQSPELLTTTVKTASECGYILSENDSPIQKLNGKLPVSAKKTLKGKKTKVTNKKKSSVLRNQRNKDETKQKPVDVNENEAIFDDPKSNNIKNQFAINKVLNSSNSGQSTVKCVQGKSAGDSSENSVFKQLYELSFIENGLGCSAAQCFSVNNHIKCGVFKLKAKAQIECRTLHSNNLGGVLLNGHLRMKIGIKEQDMKEGDMAFVPPLTEWRAINIGQSESVFYYWCGRFGSHSLLN